MSRIALRRGEWHTMSMRFGPVMPATFLPGQGWRIPAGQYRLSWRDGADALGKTVALRIARRIVLPIAADGRVL